ncbi:hypothetical protein Purlil1_11797 [Purpureocillium lilacinum]|uniref:CFEM domain-containing protein n=1 Tax=Purpureocillium lilacinum TaxID=33203 RepID=A0ABR0BII8_PURLI|nr:hypothetical protein Purlil1_11797 [Purpureocillium lilacinum]
MKFTLVVVVAFVTLVGAQSWSDIPGCALPCIHDAVKKNTKCPTDDFSCICRSFSALQTVATPCIVDKCGNDDVALRNILPASQSLCKNVGKGSSAPTPSSSPTSTGSATATSSATATTLVTSGTPTSNAGGSVSHTSIDTYTGGPSGAVDPNISSSSSSLSKGAIAGIVIGSVTAALLMVASGWWIGRQGANKQRCNQHPMLTDNAMNMTDAWVMPRGPAHMAGGSPLSEVAAEGQGQQKPYELPAQTH